ncbi:hypothetical protein IAR50_005919 [Cryptococcus sp. DSM 104548]
MARPLDLMLPFLLVESALALPADSSAQGSASTSTSTFSSESSTSTDCDYDGNVSDYLSCAKDKISTTALIGAGIGITLGIFALAFGCIWITRRKRKKVADGKDREDTAAEEESGESRSDGEKGGRTKRARQRKEESEAEDDWRPVKLREDEPPTYQEVRRNQGKKGNRHEDMTDSSSSELDPLPKKSGPRKGSRDTIYSQRAPRPAPTPVQPTRQAPFEESGSPGQEVISGRQLYPSNPSPDPRHLQPHPLQRSATNASRTSVFSTYSTRPPVRGPQLVQPALPSASTARMSISSSFSSRQRQQPPTSRGSPQPPLPLPPAMRTSVHSRAPLRGAAGSRPTSSVSSSEEAPSTLGSDVPPMPALHGQTSLSSSRRERPPTRLMRSESHTSAPSQVPPAQTFAMPSSLPTATSDPTNLTAPLNIRKSAVPSNYLPSYYQPSISDRPESGDRSNLPFLSNKPDKPEGSSLDPSPGNKVPMEMLSPSSDASTVNSARGEKADRRGRSSSGSEGSGVGIVQAIPPFKGKGGQTGQTQVRSPRSTGAKEGKEKPMSRRPSETVVLI